MTNTSPAALAALKAANARNKLIIQQKRTNFAITKASLENLPHNGKFPTKYKYG